MYLLKYSSHAQKDVEKIKKAGLKNKVEKLLEIISENPWNSYPPYEKLVGDLRGCYSRRINAQHRLVYEVFVEERAIKILRMWSHYE